jgi:hypothetical protein
MRSWFWAVADRLLALVIWGMASLLFALMLSGDVHVPTDTAGQVRTHIRDIQFDFVTWSLSAAGSKVHHAGLSEQAFLDEASRSQTVLEYFGLRRELESVERAIARTFADPDVSDPVAVTADLHAQELALREALHMRQSLAEAILQEQLSVILAHEGLAWAGQPVPPVAFSITPLPYALIISPRASIRQDANLDVSGALTLEERVALEEAIAEDLDVSTLTVPLGGIGTYPTMIGQSSDLYWVASVVAHEWLHNYLTVRPLGVNYFTSPELRTMNETVAEMVGDELGALLVERYYPELARPPEPFRNILRRDDAPPPDLLPVFDFRAEMRITRVTVDGLLEAGQIEEAEAYMEMRRRFMWDNGYQLRKLNQAYFAFYGAYAAGPGGAAGEDPVGAAVRLLRRRSPTIQSFVDTMAWFTSFEQLQRYLNLPPA